MQNSQSRNHVIHQNFCSYASSSQRKNRLRRKKTQLKRDRQIDSDEYKRLAKELNFTRKKISKFQKQGKEEQTNRLIKKYNPDDPTSFWKIVRQLKNSEKKSEMAQEVHFTINSKVVLAKTNSEKAKCFANVLGTTMEAKSYPEIGLSPIQTRHWDDELIVDCTELDSILKTKRNSAPGEDNITYKQIKQITVELRTTICALLTSCLNIGLTPETWKHSKIVMIPKANKDRKEGKNYRPISLTSCLAKLLETAAKSRLTKHCERYRIISDNQTAYRKSRCTTDNLTKLTETIEKGLKTKRHTATIFLDVEKAFDSVHHETLIQKLHDLGLNPRLTHWITDFLRGRKCTIEINKCQPDAFYPRAGVP